MTAGEVGGADDADGSCLLYTRERPALPALILGHSSNTKPITMQMIPKA
ncbi:MAG TPA: hypothetical protein VHR65_03910 [Solirubrobacterales bacterium]|nr:hypothetical protein [Solirubrobacterales bacterium]